MSPSRFSVPLLLHSFIEVRLENVASAKAKFSKSYSLICFWCTVQHISPHPKSSAASASSDCEGYSLWFTSACFHNITSVSCNAQTPFNEKYLVGFPCVCGKLSPPFCGTVSIKKNLFVTERLNKSLNIYYITDCEAVISGKQPHKGDSNTGINRKHQQHPSEPKPMLWSDYIGSIIIRCWLPDPSVLKPLLAMITEPECGVLQLSNNGATPTFNRPSAVLTVVLKLWKIACYTVMTWTCWQNQQTDTCKHDNFSLSTSNCRCGTLCCNKHLQKRNFP